MLSSNAPRRQLKQALSGSISEMLVTVEDNASWVNLELGDCVIVGGPSVGYASFFNVTSVNCLLPYDGMELSGGESPAFAARAGSPGALFTLPMLRPEARGQQNGP